MHFAQLECPIRRQPAAQHCTINVLMCAPCTGQKTLAEVAIPRRIHFIYERAARKFKSDLDLWLRWIELCKKLKSTKRLSKVGTMRRRLRRCLLQWRPARTRIWFASTARGGRGPAAGSTVWAVCVAPHPTHPGFSLPLCGPRCCLQVVTKALQRHATTPILWIEAACW